MFVIIPYHSVATAVASPRKYYFCMFNLNRFCIVSTDKNLTSTVTYDSVITLFFN